MKKIIKIEGIDCANCAKVLENEINKLDGIKNAKINFIKSTLSFESNDTEKALKDITKLTKYIEPDAKIVKNFTASKKYQGLILNICTLITGIGIGACALFIPNLPIWLFWCLYIASALLLGYKTYYKAFTLLFKGIINENLLIMISVIGAASVGEKKYKVSMAHLYEIGKIFEGIAVNKSRRSIEELTNLQPEYAVLIEGDQERKVLPSEVKLGSIIIVRPGEKIPIDGVIIDGKSMVDMKSLTGENLPVSKKKNDEILSGSIAMNGVLQIRTTSEYSQCTVSKIMNMIENASEKKSKAETFISKFTRWYTLIVIACALLTWGISWAVTKDFGSSLYRGLTFLVISCPCAFAISVPLAYFSGIGNASRRGILIKGSNYLDACAKLTTIGFDKTGTLTNGKFNILEILSFDKKLDEEEIVYLCALGEQYSNHPLAKSITHANKRKLVVVKEIDEQLGKGVSFTYRDNRYFVGRKGRNTKNTTIELYRNNKKIGEIHMVDALKENSPIACSELAEMGIRTVLLSGDNKESVQTVASLAGVSEAYYEILPEDKFKWVEEQKSQKNSRVAFVGDGINDAPALMLADVGIAMGITGMDATIEASDIVIVNDDPSKVATAIRLSRYTRKIVWENIIFSIVVKVAVLILGIANVTNMLVAVFADVGVTLLAILNSIRALKHNPNKNSFSKKIR